MLRRLHRWFGIGAACFLLLLSCTGLLLNHSERFALDSRYVGPAWLLDRYGISGPEFGSSFKVGGRWVTRAGERLYLDQIPIVYESPAEIAGAVALGEEIVIALPTELLMVSNDGQVVDRVPTELSVPGPIAGIAPTAGGLVILSAGQVYLYDERTLSIEGASYGPVGSGDSATETTRLAPVNPEWIRAEPLPADFRARIESIHRGQGLSIERLLADLHSGRLMGLGGIAVMDLAAIAAIFLAISGIVIWFRR